MIIVNAPFRSGSTALASALRATGSAHVFYEPLHEGLWNTGWSPVDDPTHQVAAEDYFAEYRALDRLCDYADVRRLAFAASLGDRPRDRLRSYLDHLADSAPDGATVVFQFNRTLLFQQDLAQLYPEARLVYLDRDPAAIVASIGRFSRSAFPAYYLAYWCSLTFGRSPHPGRAMRLAARRSLATLGSRRFVALVAAVRQAAMDRAHRCGATIVTHDQLRSDPAAVVHRIGGLR
jgi:RimJ/RimL family protein N-acetyltransferase